MKPLKAPIYKVPSSESLFPTINRFKHRLGVEGLKRIFKRLVNKLVGKGVIDGKAGVVEATPLEAFKSDPEAERVFKAKGKPFFGYKVSLVSDFRLNCPWMSG